MPLAIKSIVCSNSWRVHETLPMSLISCKTNRFNEKGISGATEFPIATIVAQGRAASMHVAKELLEPTASKSNRTRQQTRLSILPHGLDPWRQSNRQRFPIPWLSQFLYR